MLGLEAAMSFIAHTPLPDQSLDDEDEHENQEITASRIPTDC